MPSLSSHWSRSSKEALKLIWEASKEPKDRLDLLNLMNLSLYAMARSLVGWYQRLDDPELLSALSDEELGELAQRVSSIAREFVKYDIKASRRYHKRGLKSEEFASLESLFPEVEDLALAEEEEP